MKIDFKEMITDLKRQGFTEQYLVSAMEREGVICSQPTINRLKNGVIKAPNYEIGLCLVKIYEQIRQRKRKHYILD